MTRYSSLTRYGVVLLIVTVAMLLRWPLWPILQGELAFLFLWPTVVVCAWWGGLGPGLVATILSALAATFFLLRSGLSDLVINATDLVGLGVFVSVGAALSFLSEKMHRKHRLAERRADEVARQREWLRISLASIGDAVIATDTDGRVSFLNPAAQTLTGWASVEAQGQPLEKVFPIINEATRLPVENPVARVIKEGVVVGLANHTILMAKNGAERPIEDSAAPIKDDGGNIIGVILVFHDVTERRRQAKVLEERTAELALAKSHLEAIFNTVIEGIVVFDEKGNLIFCNEAEARIAGFASPADMMRNLSYFVDIFELTEIAGNVVPVEQWPVSRVMRGESFTEWECRGRRKDTGQEWEFSFGGNPVKGDDGRQALSVVVTRDITARKAAERALRQSEEEFRTSFELAAVGKVQIDPTSHRFVRANRKFCAITGYSPEELRELRPFDLTHPDDRDDDLDKLSQMLRGEIPVYSNDKRYVRKDRQSVWVNVTATLVRDSNGAPIRTIGVVQDLTERKRLEEQLRERITELATADRCKNEFVMMLAHELRNPLAPIRNGLQLLQESQNDVQIVEHARTIMARQIGHMTRIIDDLLDVSRLARGRVELRAERLDLSRLTRTAMNDQKLSLQQARISLEQDLPELPVWVNADPTRLTQVLDNLLQNALKFTDEGGRIWVRVHADPSHQQAVLSIRDSGVGIEPELLPHLFETFTQGDRSLDRGKGGLGLGLSLVRGLVQLQNGIVEAHSDGLGCGAKFVVYLPLVPEPAVITEIPSAPIHAPKRLRVLVVEDNRDAADSLKMLLELFGYDVTVAYTGPTGVQAAKECRPDVVLCDIGLPGLDGFGVVRQLRQDPATAKARMIAVTGYGSEEDRLKSRQAGFDDHVTKPADPVQLQGLLAGSPSLN